MPFEPEFFLVFRVIDYSCNYTTSGSDCRRRARASTVLGCCWWCRSWWCWWWCCGCCCLLLRLLLSLFFLLLLPLLLLLLMLLRGTILNRTYGTHKNLYILLFLPTMFGPIYYGPPLYSSVVGVFRLWLKKQATKKLRARNTFCAVLYSARVFCCWPPWCNSTYSSTHHELITSINNWKLLYVCNPPARHRPSTQRHDRTCLVPGNTYRPCLIALPYGACLIELPL